MIEQHQRCESNFRPPTHHVEYSGYAEDLGGQDTALRKPDQNGVSRVYLASTALSELNLKPGMLCHIWKKDDLEKKEAIAWLTTEKSTNKKVIHMSKTFQDVCDFKLADDLLISGAGTLGIAESIFFRDITSQESVEVAEIEGEDRSHWEWFLRENLSTLRSFSSFILFWGFPVFIFPGALSLSQ